MSKQEEPTAAESTPDTTHSFALRDLGPASAVASDSNAGLEAVYDVPVTISAILGTTTMPVTPPSNAHP